MLKIQPEQTAISVITRAEILAGINEDDKDAVVSLLDQYELLVIDQPVADMAADLRRIHRWKLPDAFQAALAQVHKIKLVTRNTKDFAAQKHDFVEIPYSL